MVVTVVAVVVVNHSTSRSSRSTPVVQEQWRVGGVSVQVKETEQLCRWIK